MRNADEIYDNIESYLEKLLAIVKVVDTLLRCVRKTCWQPGGVQGSPGRARYVRHRWVLDRFTKELFLNFGRSRPFLMEDFIALPIPQKNFVQMLPLPLVLALVFFTRVGISWRRQKTTCGSIVCHFLNVSHLFCTNTPYTTPKNGQQQRQ